MSQHARALLLLVLLPLLFVARAARADDPEVTATVDTQRLGVGEVLRLSLHAASRQHQPASASITNTRGFTIVGSSSSPSQQVSITNGRMVSQRGLDAAWSLRAEKVGTWSVGPVTVRIGAETYKAGPIQVTVVPAGQGPARAAPDPLDPFGSFDPFRSLIDQLNGQGPSRGDVTPDPKLAMDAPLGSIAFIHAIADRTEAVVGQQVTVSMYLYVDANTRDPGLVDIHEATAPDFVKRTLFEDDSDRAVAHALAGGRMYSVRLLRKWALFPLKEGDLTVTPMELTLQRTRSTGDPLRRSETLQVHVTAPPADHRPPGYQLGDVGRWTLNADVSPRDVDEDAAVGVTLTLQGKGNLPAMITPPAQAGVEWLAPETHEKLGPQPHSDEFGGTRTFTYVVRIHKTGDVGLGWIRLPFWDPAVGRYDTARVDLGMVTVRPSATPKAKADIPVDPFSTAPDARATMGGNAAPRTNLAFAHATLFWLLVTATPLSFLLFSTTAWIVREARARAEARAASPETELKARLSLAEKAARGEDARALSAAAARALEAATVAYADVNVRDARGGEARTRLVDAGVTDDVARKVDGVLADCEAARFSPEAPELVAARELWSQAKDAIHALRSSA